MKEKVLRQEKTAGGDRIREMFDLVSPRYDLLNHLLSAGEDIRWRRYTAKALPKNAALLLDLASGTADMAILAKKWNPALKVVAVDFSSDMLKIGAKKCSTKGSGDIQLVKGDGFELPFRDGTFDAVTIAFGLRNFPDRLAGLLEMCRVTRVGGKIFVLEMTLPRDGVANRFFSWYLAKVIPFVAGALSSDRKAYSYLSSSIENFLTPDDLSALFLKAGLSDVKNQPLTFGITCLHEGTVTV